MRGSFCAAASLAALLTIGMSPALAIAINVTPTYDHPAAKVKVNATFLVGERYGRLSTHACARSG